MPTSPRLFVQHDLVEGRQLTLDQDQSNYLSRVLRLQPGDEVRLFNARHGEWQAVIAGVGARNVALGLGHQIRAQPPLAAAPILVFAPLKKDATDLIIEKATELGAARLVPVTTERTQTHTVRLDRWRKIALEAAEQCERLDLPVIDGVRPLMPALEDLPAGTGVIFCDEAGDDEAAPWGGGQGRAKPLAGLLSALTEKPAAILVGPEGGFSPNERRMLRARKDTYAVSLGPRILRAETACIAALAVWQANENT